MGGLCSFADDDARTEAVPGSKLIGPPSEVPKEVISSLLKQLI